MSDPSTLRCICHHVLDPYGSVRGIVRDPSCGLHGDSPEAERLRAEYQREGERLMAKLAGAAVTADRDWLRSLITAFVNVLLAGMPDGADETIWRSRMELHHMLDDTFGVAPSPKQPALNDALDTLATLAACNIDDKAEEWK